jgi:hypothetical protein
VQNKLVGLETGNVALTRFNNKWDLGKVCWEPVVLPSYLDGYSGILPLQVTLDPSIGSETAIYIFDRTPFAHEIAALRPFNLNLLTGLIPCQAGPVLFLLFWLPQPAGEGVFAAFENTVNPHSVEHLQPYWDLARQTHWHVFVLGPDNEELDWFEFENLFAIGDTLDQVADVIPSYPCVNFDKAKAEFEAQYTMDDLFNL